MGQVMSRHEYIKYKYFILLGSLIMPNQQLLLIPSNDNCNYKKELFWEECK
jgi:hypothetical protein